MTDLTEQWKKGELPEGHYYIKTHSETNIDEYIQWYKDHGIPSEKSFAYFNVQQVLAPVPSYEEWQASEKYNKHLEEVIKIYERKDKQATETSVAYNKLAEENAQLKEQINKCCLDAINRGTENTVKAVKEFGMPERIKELVEQNAQLKEYERIVTSYNMKPIDYDIACETVNKLLDERKALKEQNAQLKELLKECKDVILDYNNWIMSASPKDSELMLIIDEVLNAK